MLAGLSFLNFLQAGEPAPEEIVAPRRIGRAVAELIEQAIEWLHDKFPGLDDRLLHLITALCIVVIAVFLRRTGARVVLWQLERWGPRTKTGIDKSLFREMLAPLGALLMVCGIYIALLVLNLSEEHERVVADGAKVALTCVFLWGFFAVGVALLDHAEKSARSKNLEVAAFMPLIRKTLGAVFVVLAVLIVAESLGANVMTFLTGLGIGGLAFALAAQDTLANMFGSFAVMMDRPFRVGDTIRIDGNEGTVEDIGLRSTRLRTGARTQIIMPN
jgi:MscS family membrane protein